MQKYFQRWFSKFLIKEVFHTISAEDILTVSPDGKWFHKGKELDVETIAVLKAQAEGLAESRLWKILKAEIQWLAVKTLMESGKSESDIRVAQILGYLTRVIDEKLHSMSESERRRG